MSAFFNVNRMEFLVTKNCNSRCKHCSVITPTTVADCSFANLDKLFSAIEKLIQIFDISSVMTYGGEPLLFPQITTGLHFFFKEKGVVRRELITNGYISKDADKVVEVSKLIVDSGVTQILLSVDAFHQENIPQYYVELLIKNILDNGFKNILLHPAWLVNEDDDNSYNMETKKILSNLMSKFTIGVSKGNVIALAGHSRKLLAEFYEKVELDLSRLCGEIPHTNSLTDIKNLRFLPNGNVNICRGICIGNIYEDKIETILTKYSPYSAPLTSILLSGGVAKLVQRLNFCGANINPSEYYGICDLCAECIKMIEQDRTPIFLNDL